MLINKIENEINKLNHTQFVLITITVKSNFFLNNVPWDETVHWTLITFLVYLFEKTLIWGMVLIDYLNMLNFMVHK